jgi:hypothetical protein
MVKQLEKTMGGWYKNTPPLSKGLKEGFAKAAPWIAVVIGVFQILAAWDLWSIMRVSDRLRHNTEVLNQYYTKETVHSYGLGSSDRLLIYASIVLLVISAVLLLTAYTELSKRTRRGWELLFKAGAVYIIYMILSLFINGSYHLDAFVISVILAAVGFYLLFQVQDKFIGKSTK